MSMAWRNIVAGLVVLGFSAWYAWLADGLPERSLPNTPGPSFFPFAVITLVAILSIALVIKGVVGLREDRAEAEPQSEPDTDFRHPALTVAAFLAYLAILAVAGFIVASILFFGAMMVLYGSRRPLLVCGASVAIPILLFVIFRYGFQVVLPPGIFGI